LTTTTNLGLTTYSTAAGSAVTFLDYRLTQNGLAGNLSIIDSWAGGVSGSISSLKINSFITIPASEISTNYYEATSPALTGYVTNSPINLKLNTSISGSATLNINGYGIRNLMKVDSSGNIVNLVSGDITINKYNPFVYNGTYWILMGQSVATSGSHPLNVTGTIISDGILTFSGSSGSLVKSSSAAISSTGSMIISGSLTLNGNQIQNYAEKSLVTSQGTTYNIDWSAASLFEITLTNNIGLTFSNLVGGRSITALLIQDGTGGRTITSWPNVKWTSGSVPTLSSGSTAVDVFTFVTRSAGSTVLGFPAGLDMK
jgi:hypothetical protein